MTDAQTEAREIETQAWCCDEWPEWLHKIVDETCEVADRLDMSAEQAHAYAVLTALAAKDAELAEAKTQLDCALIREGNEKHRAKIAHQNMNAEINARERAEAGERAAHDAANTAIRQRDEARAQLAEARKALANYDRWLNGRDAYIVQKGLWQNFVASLPGSPTARRALEAQGGENV